MSEELKPCPFCGDDAEIMIKDGSHAKAYDIKCMNDCCYLAYGAYWFFDTKEEAIQAWNKRESQKEDVK